MLDVPQGDRGIRYHLLLLHLVRPVHEWKQLCAEGLSLIKMQLFCQVGDGGSGNALTSDATLLLLAVSAVHALSRSRASSSSS